MEGCRLEGDQRSEESLGDYARADDLGQVSGEVKWQGCAETCSSAGKEPSACLKTLFIRYSRKISS